MEKTGGRHTVQIARMTARALSGKDMVSDVPGIGDAVAMPMNSARLVRKGETTIAVDMRMTRKNIDMAKTIVSRALAPL